MEVLATAIREEKEIKEIQVGKVGGKLRQEESLSADKILLHTENPKDGTRKLPDFINEFGKVAGHKTDTQKKNGAGGIRSLISDYTTKWH